MNNRLLILFLIILGSSIFATGQDAVADQYMQFEKTRIDLGTIEKGAKVTLAFTFTNVSKVNLQIDMVSVCECSEADWSWKSIKPNEKGNINVIFDSSQKDSAEVISLDVNLMNEDPATGYPIFKTLEYIYQYE